VEGTTRDIKKMYRQTQWETFTGLSIGFAGTLGATLCLVFNPYNPGAQFFICFALLFAWMSLMCTGLNLSGTVKRWTGRASLLCFVINFVADNCMFDVAQSGHPWGVVGKVGLVLMSTVLGIVTLTFAKWLWYMKTYNAPWRPIAWL
jgi:Kef-type K+ transport system membrane component KefB